MNSYDLATAPPYTQCEYDESGAITNMAEGTIMWSGDFMPKIGDRVNVTVNGFGLGRVASYFVEGGFLGVKVVLDSRPEWHRKQNPGRDFVLVFGMEIKELTS